jgi:hypothetical protein
MMTITKAELIKALKDLPDDTKIFVNVTDKPEEDDPLGFWADGEIRQISFFDTMEEENGSITVSLTAPNVLIEETVFVEPETRPSKFSEQYPHVGEDHGPFVT